MANRFMHPLRLAAVASGLCLFALTVLSFYSGANQQHFEMVMTPQVYAQDLLKQAEGLRYIITLDDFFIACYVTVSILFVPHLTGSSAPSLRPWIVGMGVAAGVLDFVENHHILAMLHQAQAGGIPDVNQLIWREDFSSLKWLLGHTAFFMVGWCMPTHSIWLRLFQFALIFVQLPVGALTLTVQDPMWAPILHLARLVNVMTGFFLVAWLFPTHLTEKQ